MSPRDRRVVSGAALLVGVVAVVVMAVWGVTAFTAPIGDGEDPADFAGPNCPVEDQVITEFVKRSEVTVSVYNTGDRKGHAGRTLARFEAIGFAPGAVGDADEGDRVRRAEVRTTTPDSAAARLVARTLGRDVPVVVVDEDYGPGVDVFIGDRLKGLVKKPPTRERLSEPITSCR